MTECAVPQDDHWPPGFNFNLEEWDANGQSYETLCLSGCDTEKYLPKTGKRKTQCLRV
jgi:hypothetical protein